MNRAARRAAARADAKAMIAVLGADVRSVAHCIVSTPEQLHTTDSAIAELLDAMMASVDQLEGDQREDAAVIDRMCAAVERFSAATRGLPTVDQAQRRRS